MLNTRARRFAALFGVVGLLTAAVGMTVVGTGAYFTDSHGGQIQGTNGGVTVLVTGSGGGTGGMEFDFSGILPGMTKTANITISNTTANAEDVYIAFDNAGGMWSAVNNLGQFGKFSIGGYTYDNLNNKFPAAPTPGQPGAPIPGSFMTGSCSTVPRVGANYLPRAVKLASLAAFSTTTVPMSFTYNPCMTNHQNETLFNAAENDIGGTATITPGPLTFSVVAFQGGVDPTSPFNGAAALTPLNLSGYGTATNQYVQN